jgi:hypothetical protein
MQNVPEGSTEAQIGHQLLDLPKVWVPGLSIQVQHSY